MGQSSFAIHLLNAFMQLRKMFNPFNINLKRSSEQWTIGINRKKCKGITPLCFLPLPWFLFYVPFSCLTKRISNNSSATRTCRVCCSFHSLHSFASFPLPHFICTLMIALRVFSFNILLIMCICAPDHW